MREVLGVKDRPLLNAMIKPNIGWTADEGAELFYKACKGGVDVIKDDELMLADGPFCPLEERVKKFMAKEKPGKIINISSMLAFFGGMTVPAYAASKGAVTQMTKAFCNEWASKGINVNCIAPGYMDTEMNTALTDPANPRFAEITNRIPARRWGTPDDMKGTVIFLASPASDYLNGAVIPVDGGYLVK